MTRQTALDYSKENIRVNSICPGFIETPELIHYLSQTENPKLEMEKVIDYHPIGRIGTTEEVANDVEEEAPADTSATEEAAADTSATDEAAPAGE